MEKKLLKAAHFCLSMADPLDFLNYYLKISNLDQDEVRNTLFPHISCNIYVYRCSDMERISYWNAAPCLNYTPILIRHF